MLTRTYKAFSVLLGCFCSTIFWNKLFLWGFALPDASILKNFGDASTLNSVPVMAGFLNKSLDSRNTRLTRARGKITGFKRRKKTRMA
jgi:hypothetical protein